MKDTNDKSTTDLFQAAKRLGRPVTGHAKTDAQRMREYRQRRKEQGARVIVQYPEQLQNECDYIHNLYNELNAVTAERDEALQRVAELQKQLKRLSLALN